MKKLFQTEWQGIPFSTFADLDAKVLAGVEFYSRFYEEFFRRYESYEQLDRHWSAEKLKVSELLKSRLQRHDLQMLSIGCGLGHIERELLKSGFLNLEITETSTKPLRWIAPLFSPEKVHVGFFPECLPSGKKFDYILMSAIDYCFDNQSWLDMLSKVRKRLVPGGKCLIVSVSFQGSQNWIHKVSTLWREVKGNLLHGMRLRRKGQFWGYIRTSTEQQLSVSGAGFKKFEEGTIGDSIYWIEATNS